MVSKTDGLSSLLNAVRKAKLEDALKEDRPMTVFAPNDDAFNKLPTNVKDMNQEELTKLVKRHVVFDTVKAKIDITENEIELNTAGNDKVKVKKEGSDVIIELSPSKATVVGADTFASNGVIHIIDTVLTGEEG